MKENKNDPQEQRNPTGQQQNQGSQESGQPKQRRRFSTYKFKKLKT